MIETQQEQQLQNNESLVKLSFDSIKQNDLKFMFEVLNTSSQNRTIADLDTLVKIMLHIEPIKKLQNMSIIYLLCQKMTLIKYKTKDIIYEDNDKAQSLYIILSGKVAFYKKSTEYFDNDQIIFLNSGSCFGKFYQWKIKFLPISIQQTLLAVISKIEINKISLHLTYQRQIMINQLKNSDIFINCQANIEQLQQASKLLVLNKIPCGNYLIRDGQTPKAIFYILKGVAKNIINKDGKIYEIKRFPQGQYSPKSYKKNYKYDLIAETSCQVIVIPKKSNPRFCLILRTINEIRLKQVALSQELMEKLQVKLSRKFDKQTYCERTKEKSMEEVITILAYQICIITQKANIDIF